MPITSHLQRQDVVLDGPLVWPGPTFLVCASVPWGAQGGTSWSTGRGVGIFIQVRHKDNFFSGVDSLKKKKINLLLGI